MSKGTSVLESDERLRARIEQIDGRVEALERVLKALVEHGGHAAVVGVLQEVNLPAKREHEAFHDTLDAILGE